MRITLLKSIVISTVLVLGLLGVPKPAHAGSLVNGDFSQGSDGLLGWTVDPSGSVSVSGGQATLFESASASKVELFQNFTLPTDALSLSFTLVTWIGEDPQGFLPDAFGASLLKPTTGASLVPTVDSSTDSFYIRDLDPNVSHGDPAPTGVTVSPSPGALPLLVTVDVSAVAGQDAQILFRLIGGGPTLDEASVTISNVLITTSGSAVPEPSSLTLAVLGTISIAGYLGLRRRRAA